MNRPGYQISKWVILSVFVVGAGSLAFFLWHSDAVHKAERWPRADATVLNCQVTFTTNLLEGQFGNRVIQDHETVFSFSYAVAGREYLSHRFYVFGPAPAYVAERDYLPGHRFKAYYNPLSPEVAMVEPGPIYYRILVASLVCLGLAMTGMVYNWRLA